MLLKSIFRRFCAVAGACVLVATLAPAAQADNMQSESVFVQDLSSASVLYDKNSEDVRPIASITKLMTALVVAESGLSLQQNLSISTDDIDRLRNSRSRLAVGTQLTRADMMHLALMSSENRAAHALGRHYPGGMLAPRDDTASGVAFNLGYRRDWFAADVGSTPVGFRYNNIVGGVEVAPGLGGAQLGAVARLVGPLGHDDGQGSEVAAGAVAVAGRA